MITYRKVGGLHFIKLANRFQVSFCRLSVRKSLDHSIQAARIKYEPVTYVRVTNDEWFNARDVEPRLICSLDSSTALDTATHNRKFSWALDPSIPHDSITRSVNHYLLNAKSMIESREIESVLIWLMCVPVVLIWSLLLVMVASDLNWF